MSWHAGRLAAFDIETTGVNTESDRVVTAAVSVVGGGLAAEHHSWLLNPGIEIPAGATSVHGITTERAQAEGRSPVEAIDEITGALADQLQEGVPVIAFNARFDLTILDREARRYGLLPLLDRVGGLDGMLVVDPYVLDKQFDRFRAGKRTLSAVCQHYRVPFDEAHAANADALAAARLAFRLGATVPELRDIDLPVLHREQVGWAAEQAASLEEYFRQQGRAERVERAWPIVPDGLVREPRLD
jgi:DNA polymerase-3 subunit epsilon